MNAEELKLVQAPLKQQYADEPDTATITLSARGQIGEGITCRVDTGKAIAEAGLHPATGGDGRSHLFRPGAVGTPPTGWSSD